MSLSEETLALQRAAHDLIIWAWTVVLSIVTTFPVATVKFTA